MIKILSPILLLIFFSSCSSANYKKFILPKSGEYNADTTTSLKNEEATIVIFKTSAARTSTGRKGTFDANHGKFIWCKRDEKNNCDENFYLEPKKSYEYYTIKPGEYYFGNVEQIKPILIAPYAIGAFVIGASGIFGIIPIILISAAGGFSAATFDPHFNSSLEGWDKKLNTANFISFEAKPKEIVYVGDLAFTFVKQKYWVGGKIKADVIDNYNDAMQSLYFDHPELKNRVVVKRLAKTGILPDKSEGIFW